ncbi:MAG: DUF4253 domain-containing protein [Candidatus Omnitrophica bacterium]|nr:DUF4253 domain-containing protein [Candidatus Omnitrophota bacterium]
MKIILALALLAVWTICIYAENEIDMDYKLQLTLQEEELAVEFGFDKEVLLLLKKESTGELKQLVTIYAYSGGPPLFKANGISAYVPVEKDKDFMRKKTKKIVAGIKLKLPKGYLVFQSEMNFAFKPDKVSIIKSIDQYDILRVMGTSGNDFPIENQAVIAKLKEWERNYPFEIIGAARDWVEAEFKVMPKDINAFAKEVYAICPDIVGGGPTIRTVEDLASAIEESKGFYLWWD